MPEPDLVQLSNEIYIFAALLLKFFNQAVEERLKNYGVPLTSFQCSILRMLQFETLTSSVLSQRLGLDPSAVVRIVDSLEGKGLAVRGVDPQDRRRNPIRITQKGLELLAAVPVVSQDDPSFHALQALGVESTLQLRGLLAGVMQHFPEGRLVLGFMSGQPGSEVDSRAAAGQHE